MRTTVTIDDALFIELKTYAAASNRPMSRVIEDAVRAALARRESARGSHVPLPTWGGGGGLQPGVDLDDSAGLLELTGGNVLEGHDR